MPLGVSADHLALHDAVARWAANRDLLAGARACLEGDHESLPWWWPELAELGWLGLHVPEERGGSGFGFAELGVVLEELGKAGAAGPFLPSALAAGVVAHIGGADHDELLAQLVSGERVGAVAFGPPGAPVLGGEVADVLVVPLGHAGGSRDGAGEVGEVGERWGVLDLADADRAAVLAPLVSLDATRRVARLDRSSAATAPTRELGAEPSPGWVDRVAALLLAAESVGGAAWCVDTAAAWARDRVQFGRPIGQFQAVKHRCADMLCSLELARAAVWDGLRAADEADASDARLAISAAAALAPDAFFRCAKDAVQVLGGIGFTWDHDAHIFMKRATANRLLAGSPQHWQRASADLAANGARRTLAIDPAEVADHNVAERTRTEVRAFAAALADRPKDEWRATLAADGYLAPHWPRPWGRGAEPIEQVVIDEELRAAKVRRPHLGIAGWVLPTLIGHGTIEQQDRWVRPTLLGELTWCQLFSEPGAGSDLASVATRATRVEGGWRLDGQKVWTTFAHLADYGLCVARTDPDAPKHDGLTCFVVDMHTDGIDIRPLRELTGAELFNEVFFDGVFVPDDAVVGPVNGGWRTARTTLENERVAMGSGSSFGPGVEALVQRYEQRPDGDVGELPAEQLGALVVESHALASLGVRLTLRALSGQGPGPEASVRKLLGVEHDQRVQEVGMLSFGPAAAALDGDAAVWVGGFLANRCLTIAGGTSEIQRNVIAERLLGLPRDP